MNYRNVLVPVGGGILLILVALFAAAAQTVLNACNWLIGSVGAEALVAFTVVKLVLQKHKQRAGQILMISCRLRLTKNLQKVVAVLIIISRGRHFYHRERHGHW